MWVMPIYVVMLRGINVGGQKIVKMEKLRTSFEALGFRWVRTYVQSGNVIFEAKKASSNKLCNSIKEKISDDFGFPIPLVLRTSDEMTKLANDNSFLKEKGIDSSKLHVTFLSTFPETSALGKLDQLNTDPDRFQINGGEVYVYCPNGYGRTKLSNATFEKLLSVKATSRNWKTLKALAEMSTEKDD